MTIFSSSLVEKAGRWIPVGAYHVQEMSVFCLGAGNTWSVHCRCTSVEGHHQCYNHAGQWSQTGMGSCDLITGNKFC